MGKVAVQIGNKLEQRLWRAAIHHQENGRISTAAGSPRSPPSAYTGAAWSGRWEVPALAPIGLSYILTSLSIQPPTETLMASAGIREGTGQQNTSYSS